MDKQPLTEHAHSYTQKAVDRQHKPMPRHIQQNPVCVTTLETRWQDGWDSKEVRAQGHRTGV